MNTKKINQWISSFLCLTLGLAPMQPAFATHSSEKTPSLQKAEFDEEKQSPLVIQNSYEHRVRKEDIKSQVEILSKEINQNKKEGETPIVQIRQFFPNEKINSPRFTPLLQEYAYWFDQYGIQTEVKVLDKNTIENGLSDWEPNSETTSLLSQAKVVIDKKIKSKRSILRAIKNHFRRSYGVFDATVISPFVKFNHKKAKSFRYIQPFSKKSLSSLTMAFKVSTSAMIGLIGTTLLVGKPLSMSIVYASVTLFTWVLTCIFFNDVWNEYIYQSKKFKVKENGSESILVKMEDGQLKAVEVAFMFREILISAIMIQILAPNGLLGLNTLGLLGVIGNAFAFRQAFSSSFRRMAETESDSKTKLNSGEITEDDYHQITKNRNNKETIFQIISGDFAGNLHRVVIENPFALYNGVYGIVWALPFAAFGVYGIVTNIASGSSMDIPEEVLSPEKPLLKIFDRDRFKVPLIAGYRIKAATLRKLRNFAQNKITRCELTFDVRYEPSNQP